MKQFGWASGAGFARIFYALVLMLIGGGAMFILDTVNARPKWQGLLAGVFSPEPDLSRYDFVSILLMIVTILLSVLGLFLAVFAVYTITAIKEDARNEVKNEVAKQMPLVANEFVKMYGETLGLLKPDQELEPGFDPSDRGDQ